MRIKTVKIKNFRAYKDEIYIDFDSLSAFVGMNDVGKSTILEALDIFFNEGKGVVKIEKEDVNKQAVQAGDNEISISVIFDDLPENIIIDSSNSTTLGGEYLLTEDGRLEVVKRYPNAGKEKVFIKAYHPTNSTCSDLLLKKQNDLKKLLESQDITCEDKTKNAIIRKSIWNHFSNSLQLETVEIDAAKEDAKKVWEQLGGYMPLYSLFQSDRKNSDGDSEVQDPLKLAVKEILKDATLVNSLDTIAEEVNRKLCEVSDNTLAKLQEMNPDIADNLRPVIAPSKSLKWADVFKNVSIAGDENIPINKRGSGVKRLILINFFRAEAERKQQERNVPDTIYAIEEPETSQHPDHQRKLIEALKKLSNTDHAQVIITTHSPSIVKMLDFDNLKLIKNNPREVVNVEKNNLPYPSLSEVNYLAFNESDEEYHNELYGYIESEGRMSNYKSGKPTRPYLQLHRNGNTRSCQKILSEYIRHQIHHPENTHNQRFTNTELQQSIEGMRRFISQIN